MFKGLTGSPVYLKGIILVLFLLPLWWFLGIDQFIFPIVIFILFGIYLFQFRKDLKVPFIIIPLLVFLLIYAVSGFFVVEKIRYFVYAYNFIQNISVIFLLIIIVKALKEEKHLNMIIWALFIIIFAAALLGTVGIILKESMRFTTLMAPYIPESYGDSVFLKLAVSKKIVNTGAHIFGINYTRVQSLFIHDNNYAQVLTVMIPLVFFLNSSISLSRSLRTKYMLRVFLFTGLVLMAFNLLFTTSRSALIGITAGFIWWVLFWKKWPLRSKKNLYITITVLLILVLCSIILIFYFDIIVSARPGSLNTRMLIYEKSIESWLERPFFGWGVTRSIADVFPEVEIWKGMPPMGTHGTYLGILYKQGIVGLLIFFWFLAHLWFLIGRGYRRLKNSKDGFLFMLIGFASWGLIANLVQGIFNMLDLVSASFHITWINIAVIITALMIVRDNKGAGKDA